MNLTRALTLLAPLLALLPAAAHAKDEQRLFDIAAVLASPEGKERFDDTIRFYWSGQSAPTALQAACGVVLTEAVHVRAETR